MSSYCPFCWFSLSNQTFHDQCDLVRKKRARPSQIRSDEYLIRLESFIRSLEFWIIIWHFSNFSDSNPVWIFCEHFQQRLICRWCTQKINTELMILICCTNKCSSTRTEKKTAHEHEHKRYFDSIYLLTLESA